jgi:hypothetical protein
MMADGAGYGLSEADDAALNNVVSEPEVEVSSTRRETQNARLRFNVVVVIYFMLV